MRGLVEVGLAFFASLGCGESMTRLELPSDDDAFFLIHGDAVSRRILRVVGPILRGHPSPIELTVEPEAVLLFLGLDAERLQALGSRFDPRQLDRSSIERSTPELLGEATCREQGVFLRDLDQRSQGFELPLERVLGVAAVASFEGSSDRFEAATTFPLSSDGWSFRAPLSECLPGLELEARPFVHPSSWDPDAGLSEVAWLDDDAVVVVRGALIQVYRRGQAAPVAEWVPTEWEADAGSWIEVAAFLRDDWPRHVDILFYAVRRFDAPDRSRALYSIRYGPTGFGEPRELFRRLSPGTESTRDLRLSRDGRLAIVGSSTFITASSTTGPFVEHDALGISLTKGVWTDRRGASFIMGDYYGGLWSGDPERGLRSFAHVELFSDPRPVFAVAEDSSAMALYVATDGARFKTDRGGAWRELDIAVGDEALACALPEHAVCGLRSLKEGGGGVRELSLAEGASGERLLVFAPKNCTGFFAADPAAECARAIPLYGERIEFSGQKPFFRMDWRGDRGILVVNSGEIVELALRVSR